MKKLASRGLTIVLLIMTISLSRGVWDSYQKLDDLKTTESEVKALKTENANLEEEKLFRQTDFYIEKAAREKLGLAKTGETVIVAEETASKSAQEENDRIVDNWRSWFDLFFY